MDTGARHSMLNDIWRGQIPPSHPVVSVVGVYGHDQRLSVTDEVAVSVGKQRLRHSFLDGLIVL